MLAFATSVLSGLSDLLAPFAGANAMALAVVVFTVAVRLAIAPLSVAQARGERRRAALAPRLQEIRQRYGDQPDRLREEFAALGVPDRKCSRADVAVRATLAPMRLPHVPALQSHDICRS